MSEPSELILACFSGVGSPSLTCMCGRRHHAPDSCEVGEHEESEMLDDYATSPNKVVLHRNDDSVYAKQIDGMNVVPDCPCGWLARFESLIWNERERVVMYYRNRRAADAKSLENLDQVLRDG